MTIKDPEFSSEPVIKRSNILWEMRKQTQLSRGGKSCVEDLKEVRQLSSIQQTHSLSVFKSREELIIGYDD